MHSARNCPLSACPLQRSYLIEVYQDGAETKEFCPAGSVEEDPLREPDPTTRTLPAVPGDEGFHSSRQRGRGNRRHRAREYPCPPDEEMPGDMVEALHWIDGFGSGERFDELLELAAANQIEAGAEVTALDLATQIWLKNPEALQRKQREEFFRKRKTFESFRAADPDVVIAIDDLAADLSPLEASLDVYFL